MKVKSVILRNAVKWHKGLGWAGGFALIAFAFSGLLHPLMVWTGPQAAAFFPPRIEMNVEHAMAVPRILAQNNIDDARMVKIVPSADGAVLQVSDENTEPRRYFDLQDGTEKPGYDENQAIWLARYYTGLADTQVRSVTFQNKFDAAYPWVNRLLPVYRVAFETDDNMVAFVYTEIGALANLTNDWKSFLQGAFSVVHTWSWLDGAEYARVFIMGILLASLFGMGVIGVSMIFLLKHRKIMDVRRKWHRYAAIIIWVPILSLCISGSLHLLYYSGQTAHNRGLQLGAGFDVGVDRFGDGAGDLRLYQGVALNALSLVPGPGDGLLYRLGMPNNHSGGHVSRVARFDGVPIEKSSVYVDVKTGQESPLTDRDMAQYYARRNAGIGDDDIVSTSLVTRFGPDYDFRNKRLPVWRVDMADGFVFVDPGNGMIVDRVDSAQNSEAAIFSNLHKWNFIVPYIGRMGRDVLVGVVLSLAIFLTLMGYAMLLRKKRG